MSKFGKIQTHLPEIKNKHSISIRSPTNDFLQVIVANNRNEPQIEIELTTGKQSQLVIIDHQRMPTILGLGKQRDDSNPSLLPPLTIKPVFIRQEILIMPPRVRASNRSQLIPLVVEHFKIATHFPTFTTVVFALHLIQIDKKTLHTD